MADPLVLTLAVAGGALVLFVTELVPPEITALAAAAALMLLGVLTPAEGFSGFGNEATITVLCMFVLAMAIQRAGLVNILAHRATAIAAGSPRRFLVVLVVFAGIVSAFVNNTPVVAILIPLVVTVAGRLGASPSRFLIPLSYATMLGGTMTLVGTSTNVLASGLSAEMGYGAFSMFMFTKVGVVVFVVGALYLTAFGWRLLPGRHRAGQVTERYVLREYVSEVLVGPGSALVGQTVEASDLKRRFDIDVIRVFRGDETLDQPLVGVRLMEGDVLLVRAARDVLLDVRDAGDLSILPGLAHGLAPPGGDVKVVEAVVAPGSSIENATLTGSRFRQRYDAVVLAVKKRERVLVRRVETVRLESGDALLLMGPSEAIDAMKTGRDLIVTEELTQEKFRRDRIPVVLAVLAAVVGGAALGLVPISVAALSGVVVLVVTGCLRVNEFHDAIRWDVVFLLAGLIPLGVALRSSGAASLLAGGVLDVAGGFPPWGVLAVFYAATMVVTQVMSNNAAVALMIPVAVEAAVTLGLNPLTFILAVTFAASSEFMTPIGYQTNLMVYGPGEYRFLDYTRVGAPLNLIVGIVTVALLATFWPLR